MNSVYSRRIEVSQPACTVTLHDGIVHRARAGDDELRSGRRALDGDAAEQDLRDAVRVALCRRELEAFRRNVLAVGERYAERRRATRLREPTAA